MIACATRFMRRHALSVAIDALVVAASFLLGWSMRSITVSLDIRRALGFALVAMAVYCGCNGLFGLYHRLWCYASAGEAVAIANAAAAGTVILGLTGLVWPGRSIVPLGVVGLMGIFAFIGFAGVRYRRWVWTGPQARWHTSHRPTERPRTRVLIVGAGDAGQLLAWRLLNQKEGLDYELVGFVDDDPAKAGMWVHGCPVLGDRQAIATLVTRHRVDLIIIAIYNITRQAYSETLALCERTPARIKVLPNIFDFLHADRGQPAIRDVTTEDVIGRKPVQIDHEACRHLLAGKTILVTGAAGSIGSELSRQVAGFEPRRLLLLDNNESGLHDLATSLGFDSSLPPIHPVVGDVTNRTKMQTLFEQHRPQIVFHAAAYKHVPLMEAHPDEAVRVNVAGTLNIAELACRCGAERFVLISTDKAVSPTSVMGATKRLGELMISSLACGAQTLCTGVRFGNVLGSRGSVVPTFEKEIERGGPLTITHPEMTRYFMSISEAVSLVIQAATLTQGGDLFVLDMGEQIRIEELALRLIRLRGLRPKIDIPIQYIGIRPGEKLHEELTGDGEVTYPTSHPAICRLQSARQVDPEILRRQIGELVRLAEAQADGLITAKLWEIVGLYGGGLTPSSLALERELVAPPDGALTPKASAARKEPSAL